jgi:PAS domain S-box-containing protein
MTGYGADELRVPGSWMELRETGVTRPYTRQMVRKDGSRWWGLFAPARISGEGAEARCVCFILDVSELKEAEARLADSEQRFRALVEGFSQAVWENDQDANLVVPSPSWCAYTGQPVAASLGRGWLDAVHPDDREDVRREWRAALETRRAVNIEHRVQVATGGWRWTNVRAAPLFNPDGSLRKWFGMNIDIDEKRRTQDALRESEARFRALADASPALIYQFDPDGQLMYLNQRGTAQVQPEDMHVYLREVCDGIRQRAACIQRHRVPARDGGWRWFESHAAPWCSGDGLQRGYVGISLDITGAVQAEEALRDADRRKDEFLAVLAHELRNPLAPISNAVQLMRRPDGRRQSDRVVEMIGRQVRQMVRLVDDLMEVSRITRGKIDLRLERVPVAEVVHSAVESSQLAIERAGHQLVLALPEEPLVLMADRVRLTQVFANLLNNAAKYTDAGGRIRVDVWREGGQMLASVRDTGIGIPAEALPRVFDMFAQAHRAVGRGQGGLGIGLTMVRSLVEMHHGSVEAHSAGSGTGSEFVVRLPLAPAQEGWTEHPGAAEARPHAPFAGQRILVVDDNHDAADTLAMLLEADGAQVRAAYDGRGALALAESFLPSSVLLDIGMPGMDGWEVARRLRQDERFAGMRIIALTGWGQDADRRQTRNRGFSHHLTKPVSLEELHQILI